MILYAEKRGSGPLLVIMPDGTNDCEPYSKLADLMADEFTVVSFDPRGGSRSMPTVHQKVTYLKDISPFFMTLYVSVYPPADFTPEVDERIAANLVPTIPLSPARNSWQNT